MNKRIRMILFISLTLNILCLGIGGSYMLRSVALHHPKPHAMLKDLAGILPEEKLRIFEALLQRNFEKRRDTQAQIEAAHDKTETIIAAEDFDQEVFRVHIKNLDALHASRFEDMGQSLLEFIPLLTWEERKRFAEHLKKNRPPSKTGFKPR